ncbi:MAG: Cdc6/Cdc18 family protein [Candidatus Hodarchaeales archaeon]
MKNNIFLDEVSHQNLLPNYVPPDLPHRSEEIKAIASNFRGLFNKKDRNSLKGKSTNICILGSPGIGKTAISRHLMENLIRIGSKKKLNILGSYANCWQHRSYSAVLSSVFQNLDIPAATKGFSVEEQVAEILMPFLSENDAHLLLTLDEVNALSREDLNSLFAVTEEFSEHSRISIILVSRPTEWHIVAVDLNPRITEEIILYPYNFQQLKEILEYRASLALKPTAYDNEIIELITEIAFQDHNVRLGLEILFRAGQLVEAEQNTTMIDSETVRRVKSIVFPELRSEVLDELKIHELLTLLGIGRRLVNQKFSTINLKDAHRYYRIACVERGEKPNQESTFRGYIATLKSLGLISVVVSPTGRGKRGIRARISIIDIPASIIIERVEEQLQVIEEL